MPKRTKSVLAKSFGSLFYQKKVIPIKRELRFGAVMGPILMTKKLVCSEDRDMQKLGAMKVLSQKEWSLLLTFLSYFQAT